MEMSNLESDKILNSFQYMTKIIAIGAGKGGVGKSSMTVCMAYALKHLGFQVGIIDADIYGPSLHIMVPPEKNAYEENGWLYPALGAGLQLMSVAFFASDGHVSAYRAPIINTTIKRFLHGVRWKEPLDFLLIDLPPGTGDLHLTLLQSISLQGAVLVTTPQNVAISDVRKTLLLFQKMQVPLLGIIENMSYYQDPLTGEKHEIFGRGGADLLQKEFSLPLLGRVAMDAAISEALDQGRVVLKEILLEIAIEIVNRICDNADVKPVKEIDPYHVSIGDVVYRYEDLQKHCPCARCADRKVCSPGLKVDKIDRIGNYALRFHFTSGCKQGIFTWQHLANVF